MLVKTQLIDLSSPKSVWEQLRSDMQNAEVIGLDCETHDEDRHEGLNSFNNKQRHVFDHRRTTMTGFSIYCKGSDTAYYLNLAHADVENRLPPEVVPEVLSWRKKGSPYIAHNAPFELVMFQQCHNVMLTNVICSLQMAVSHHGPDEYDINLFYKTPLIGIKPIVGDILRNFQNFEGDSRSLNPDQQFTLGQFIGKTSDAAHSYNGYVKNIAWGFSLKRLTKSFFGVDQTTYEQVLRGRRHMGELTGEEVCAYGADDAFWAVMNYEVLLDRMMKENPQVLVTFLEEENPMIHVYANAWREGLRINQEEVYKQRDAERANYAHVLRQLKMEIRELQFEDELNEQMLVHQAKWYPRSGAAKRRQIDDWAMSPNSDDDYIQCTQVSNPVGNAWADERGLTLGSSRLNLTHYYAMRVLLHDLLGHKLVRVGGDVTTNSEARGRMFKTYEAEGDERKCNILRLITRLSQIEQTMKLYLTPYTQLMDPETGCLYSVISSMLASRRMAARFPNPMQLAKRGESTYVRGFYLADEDDHLIISSDWSSVELVEIGEFSGDEEFAKVFSTIPYGDLHSGATVDCLRVDPRYSWLSEEEFLQELKRGRNPMNRELRDFSGKELPPAKWVKFMRTEIGKGANFNYWYSGALGTVGDRLGWSSDIMWAAVERYRERFWQAEAWRVALIEEVAHNGYITLPDGHRRVRFEATNAWYTAMRRKFMDVCADPAILSFADLALPKIQTRAKNQAVNSMIQGMCARLAKDSILALHDKADMSGFKQISKSRFMLPIHDELVFSVHRDYAMEFIPILRECMCNHPKYIKKLPLHVNVAIGRTFRPWDGTPFSQLELDEAPVIENVIEQEWEGKALPPEKIERVIEWMMAA